MGAVIDNLKKLDSELNGIFDTMVKSTENESSFMDFPSGARAEIWPVFKSREVAVTLNRNSAGEQTEHYHREREWLFVLQGSMTLVMDGVEHYSIPGDCIEAPALTEHKPIYHEDTLTLAITIPPNSYYPGGFLTWVKLMGHSLSGADS